MTQEKYDLKKKKKSSMFNEITRNMEALSFAHNYFMLALGQRKLPSSSQQTKHSLQSKKPSVCTAETS